MLAVQRRGQQRRRTLVMGLAVVVIGGFIALAIAQSSGKGGKRHLSTALTTPSTSPSTAPAAAAPTCPQADGSSPRTTSFRAAPPRCIDPAKSYRATMATDAGTIVIALDAKRAPNTVNNFVFLARYHFYDGLTFHRVIPDFVVQGGDPKGDGTGGPGYSFADELPSPGDYAAGSLAMANSGPNTNGSQFFIVTSDNGAKTLVRAVGGQAKYSLFGKVTSGMDVVRKIEADGANSGTPKVVHKMLMVTIAES